VYHINLENLEIEKVLGSGQISKSMIITAGSFSGMARDKIEAAGGSCMGIDE
jgi:large subunit ribosomal protein L15